MQKQNKGIYLVATILVLVLMASIIGMAVLYQSKPGQQVAIVQDGEVLEIIDLSHAADRTFTIQSPEGGENVICIENGTIRIQSADCPDGTCVQMGILHSEAEPLVCLPHKLLIRFQEAAS